VPYIGTRGAAGSAIDLASATAAAGFHGSVTELQVSSAALDIQASGDLTDQYVEIRAGACAGKVAKVLGTTDAGGSQDDSLYVAGPWLSHEGVACGSGPGWIDIHYGARPGDPVSFYRMASI
ncbi:MAG: hypothetical protein AAF430_26345, partial [Myxococcota bacterium]